MISHTTRPLVRHRLRSPRAAAVAGIAFALLIGTSLVLIQSSIPAEPADEGLWLLEYSNNVSVAVTLVPFAAIAFLWFMGVIRDQLGDQEDQFFSTILYGSGLLFLGRLFAWMGSIAAILASYAVKSTAWLDSGAYIFARTLMNVMGGVVALRMAGVFMFSSGTIWIRTDVMPRWLTWLTYLVALGLLIGAGTHRILRIAFPIWVLIVSIFILWGSLRREREEEK
ncbi:MAG: hypothetical protein GTO18_16600 [Anaerolineales bacterium]|nr:hypothetical protein [Anaerolineales bacterium]